MIRDGLSHRFLPARLRRVLHRIFIGTPTIAVGLCFIASVICASGASKTVGGPFKLSASDGRTITERSFPGRWLLVYFGYTSCPDSCPTALADIAQALSKLGTDASHVQAIFITLDPRHDTREVIGDYVKSFDARILGLTGTQAEIDAAAHAYGAYALPHDPGSTGSGDRLDHSVYIYLMNPQGAFVRAFDPSWSPDRMVEAMRRGFAARPITEVHGASTGRQ